MGKVDKDIYEHCVGCECILRWDESEKYCRWCEERMEKEMKMTIGTNHGSPADRGSADAYYWRDADPHWWPEGTGKGIRVEVCDMNELQIELYMKAYNNETDRKDYS